MWNHGDGPFVSVPLFLVLTVGKQRKAEDGYLVRFIEFLGFHGDGSFVSVPLFLVLTTGKQGDRHERTVPLCDTKGPSLCALEFPLSEISPYTII